MGEMVTVDTEINAKVDKVWLYWTTPVDIMQWNHASDDWHCPAARNDLRVGGKFSSIMAAKDGSFSFDFNGIYTKIEPLSLIEYTIEGGRKVKVQFISKDSKTKVIETFETEDINEVKMQLEGWKSILNNFKKYIESSS